MAWCDLPNGTNPLPSNTLVGVDGFTVFIRVTVKSPRYNKTTDNIKNGNLVNGTNFFTIGQILNGAFTSYDAVKLAGATIAVSLFWDCDLDFDMEKCNPKITFIRVDDEAVESFSVGYNFRYANHYYLPDSNSPGDFVEYRDLIKVFGIRFIFLINGRAGKFNIVPLIINIGAGLALLGVATIISDFIALILLPDRKFYNKVKFETVEPPKEAPRLDDIAESEDEEAASTESSSLLRDKMTFK